MGAWLAANGYTVEAFERALREDMLATRRIEHIAGAIGDSAEQVRAAHLLVARRADAENLRSQLLAGADFAELAMRWSLDPSTRPAGGDLGWSPPGYLLVPEVDQAAWSLPVGEVSPVIESALGYHIVVVLERGEHPLSPDARRFLRERAVETWLLDRRAAAQIEIIPSP
jgi:parvulin-like peptidyl-prolyl isomerase